MKRSAATLAALCALALAPGCFLVGLSEDIDQQSCTSDADCGGIPAIDDDVCMAWQCRADSARGGAPYCQYTPLDVDGDGFSPGSVPVGDGEVVVCVEDSAELDCDDGLDNVFPDADESCDMLDNDCDGLSDEGVLPTNTGSIVNFDGEVGLADFAANPETRTIASVYGIGFGSSKPGASFGAVDQNEAAPQNEVSLQSQAGVSTAAIVSEIGVSALDDNNFAVALFNNSGGGRMVTAILPRQQSAMDWAMFADPEQNDYGLGCIAGEDCAMNANYDIMPPLAQPRSVRPALTSDGTHLLVSYLRYPHEDLPQCGELPTGDDRPRVLANLVRREPTGDRNLVEVPVGALDLGFAGEVTRPSIQTVPALGDVDGFLVAFLRDDGKMVVHHVRSGADGIERAGEPVLVLGSNAPVSRPRIAISEVIDDEAVMALVYQRDCGVDSTIVVRTSMLSLAGGAISATTPTPPAVVSESGAGRPSIAYSDSSQWWAVSYRDGRGLHARLLERDGRVRGAESYLLVAQNADEDLAVLQDPKLFKLDDDAVGFASAAQVKRGNDYSVELSRILSCQ